MKNRDNLFRNIAFADNLTKFISCDFEAIQSNIKVDGSIKTKNLGLNCLLDQAEENSKEFGVTKTPGKLPHTTHTRYPPPYY